MTKTFALVTGSSSGLGAEIASALARLGRNVILTGRSAARLRPVAERLGRESPGSEIAILEADLSELDGPTTLFDQIGDRQLAIDELINNAGASAPGSALGLEPAVVVSEMILDYVSASALTMLFLRHARQRGGPGRLIQILSLAARFRSMPNFAHYSSAKKAFDTFTLGVEFEIRQAGLPITVHRVYPGAISGTKNATSAITEKNQGIAMSAAQVAQAIITDSRRGKQVIIPGLINKLIYAVAPIAPQSLTDRVFFKTYGKG